MKNILVFNAGSSSYKLALYRISEEMLLAEPQNPLWHSNLACEGEKGGRLLVWVGADKILDEPFQGSISSSILQKALQSLFSLGLPIDRVVHRVVHGGDKFLMPTVITREVKKTITDLIPLAPLHNPANLKGIELSEEILPGIPQIAIFDTSFHATMPEFSSTYPGPFYWKGQGIKRYGFHGISYRYCAARCAALLKCEVDALKMVCCHLGNGASLVAIDKGKSVDTTMGFTPLDGLMMGSRCGSLDPGILLFLQDHFQQTAADLFHTLNYNSGLKGISGVSGDMREILKLASEGHFQAQLAYDMYVHSLKRYLGGMVGVLGGIDALIFTGGIGENSPKVRLEACQALRCCGVHVDENLNEGCHSDAIISIPSSRVSVLVVATQEDWCMGLEGASFIVD